MALPNPYLFMLALGTSSALGSLAGYKSRSLRWRPFAIVGAAGYGLAGPLLGILYGSKLLSFERAFWVGAAVLAVAAYCIAFGTMRAHMLDAINKRRRSLPPEGQLELIRLASKAPETANPSVKGTSCGKPQAAPYLER